MSKASYFRCRNRWGKRKQDVLILTTGATPTVAAKIGTLSVDPTTGKCYQCRAAAGTWAEITRA